MRSLPKFVNATTKEVYLRCLEFSEAELEQIVRASCNAERLIFEGCDIHCSTKLDFGFALKYKTKILNFQDWGNTSNLYEKSDWKSFPPCFYNIIDAISNSGLRFSLQTISIDKNPTLSAENVQKWLKKKGMPHISVDKNYLEIKQY